MSITSEPHVSKAWSGHEAEISDEMVAAACEAFMQAQQWLVAPARAYPFHDVIRRALEAALAARSEEDRAFSSRGGGDHDPVQPQTKATDE